MQVAAVHCVRHLGVQLRPLWPAAAATRPAAGLTRVSRQRVRCHATGKASTSLNKRLHVYVSGRVQGVFFRNYTMRKALELGVTGWVRNKRDGRVEVMAEGHPDDLESMLKWLHTGSPEAGVAGIESSWSTATDEFDAFEMLRTG
ncbi:Acylphosphatase-domain-containing protein [Scenedesmus sp. NREL 46B-D3]|nr:Acylphosphatase-domain-containing protein [Scenedesmus sp. NREL 46B-D3]